MSNLPPVRRIAWTDEEAAAMRHPLLRSRFRIAAIAAASMGVCVSGLAFSWNAVGTSDSFDHVRTSDAEIATAIARSTRPMPVLAPETVRAVAEAMPAAAPSPLLTASARAPSAVVHHAGPPAGAAEQLRRLMSVPAVRADATALGYASAPAGNGAPWSASLAGRIGETTGSERGGDDAVAGTEPASPPSSETAALTEAVEAVEAAEAVEKPAVAEDAPDAKSGKVVRTVSLRSRPGRGKVIGALKRGTKISVHECDDWCRVTADGRTGWVYPRYIRVGG